MKTETSSRYAIADAHLNRQGLSRWKSGHPWIYRAGVAMVEESSGNEAIARVLDARGGVLGMALLSLESQITLRILCREDVPIDREFFRTRLESAMDWRARIFPGREAVRLVFGESDALPGLILDRYGEHLVIQTQAWGTDALQDELVELIQELRKPESILARNDSAVRSLEGLSRTVTQLVGTTPEWVSYRQGNRSMRADLHRGQKTGAFLDQYENHLMVGGLAKGRVLDAFCYSGGFALAATESAEEVIGVDTSKPALKQARIQAKINGITDVQFVEANVFDFLKHEDRQKEKYDMVILDPPAFAKNKRELESALRGYKEINLRAVKLLRPGGVLVTCSCSYHLSETLMDEVLSRAAVDARATFRILDRRHQALDHPVRTGFPESRYLKCQVLERMTD